MDHYVTLIRHGVHGSILGGRAVRGEEGGVMVQCMYAPRSISTHLGMKRDAWTAYIDAYWMIYGGICDEECHEDVHVRYEVDGDAQW